GEHQLMTVGRGHLGQAGRVAPVACLHDLQVHLGGQGVRDNIPAQLGCGGGMWIDDEERAHALRVTRHGGTREMQERPPSLLGAAGGAGDDGAHVVGGAGVQAADAAIVLVATVLAGVDTATGQSYQVGSGIALTLIGLATAAALAAVARGLARVGRWSRTPALLTQLFVGIVGIYLVQSDRYEWGVPCLV